MSAADQGSEPLPEFVPRWQFTLLLPVRYNPEDPIAPGGRVPAGVFRAVDARLLQRFGGFTRTPLSPPILEGAWEDTATHQQYTDAHRSYRVVTGTLPEHRQFFRQFYREPCGTFRQRAIFLSVQQIELAMLPPAGESPAVP